jgi:predicted SAM-dependent methyltransferase
MKLHIGGKEKKSGWSVINIQSGPNVDYVGDITNLSEFSDDSVDEIYASHVLEHVQQAKVQEALRGMHRILRTQGVLMLSVPDMDILCHLFINPLSNTDIKFHAMQMMFGGQIDANDFHFMGYNQQFLHYYLQQAGFRDIERVNSFGLFNDTSDYEPYGFPISLNMRAIK